MAHINDQDRNVFAEAHITLLDFNEVEHSKIGRLAAELKNIIEAAKAHEQSRLAR
jgi:hypothetical protein